LSIKDLVLCVILALGIIGVVLATNIMGADWLVCVALLALICAAGYALICAIMLVITLLSGLMSYLIIKSGERRKRRQ